MPEAYHQKFRTCVANQTFAREKSALLDKWCAASKVKSFEELCELILLEEFKTCIPESIAMHLNKHKVTCTDLAAVTADEFSLVHKNVLSL